MNTATDENNSNVGNSCDDGNWILKSGRKKAAPRQQLANIVFDIVREACPEEQWDTLKNCPHLISALTQPVLKKWSIVCSQCKTDYGHNTREFSGCFSVCLIKTGPKHMVCNKCLKNETESHTHWWCLECEPQRAQTYRATIEAAIDSINIAKELMLMAVAAEEKNKNLKKTADSSTAGDEAACKTSYELAHYCEFCKQDCLKECREDNKFAAKVFERFCAEYSRDTEDLATRASEAIKMKETMTIEHLVNYCVNLFTGMYIFASTDYRTNSTNYVCRECFENERCKLCHAKKKQTNNVMCTACFRDCVNICKDQAANHGQFSTQALKTMLKEHARKCPACSWVDRDFSGASAVEHFKFQVTFANGGYMDQFCDSHRRSFRRSQKLYCQECIAKKARSPKRLKPGQIACTTCQPECVTCSVQFVPKENVHTFYCEKHREEEQQQHQQQPNTVYCLGVNCTRFIDANNNDGPFCGNCLSIKCLLCDAKLVNRHKGTRDSLKALKNQYCQRHFVPCQLINILTGKKCTSDFIPAQHKGDPPIMACPGLVKCARCLQNPVHIAPNNNTPALCIMCQHA